MSLFVFMSMFSFQYVYAYSTHKYHVPVMQGGQDEPEVTALPVLFNGKESDWGAMLWPSGEARRTDCGVKSV